MLTRDHSVGRLLVQVVGMAPVDFGFDARAFRIRPGETLLRASGGLLKPWSIPIPSLVARDRRQADRIVEAWVATTRNGSADDQTAIAVTVD